MINPQVTQWLKVMGEATKIEYKGIGMAKHLDYFSYVQFYKEVLKRKLKHDAIFEQIERTMADQCYHATKGIIFSGKFGAGKTINLKTYIDIARMILKAQTRCIDVMEILPEFKVKGDEYLKELSEVHLLGINDLGNETSKVIDFGTTRDLIYELLILRYNKFQDSGYITMATTNHSKESLTEMYGKKLADRFNEMFDFVEVMGESRR